MWACSPTPALVYDHTAEISQKAICKRRQGGLVCICTISNAYKMNKAVRSSIFLLPPGLPPESNCLFCDIMGQLVECPCEVIALNHKSRMTPSSLTLLGHIWRCEWWTRLESEGQGVSLGPCLCLQLHQFNVNKHSWQMFLAMRPWGNKAILDRTTTCCRWSRHE